MDSQEHCSNFSCQVLNLIIIYFLFICFIYRTKIEHSFDGPTIVYCPTKKGTELVSKELCGRCSDFFMLGGGVWKGDGGEGGVQIVPTLTLNVYTSKAGNIMGNVIGLFASACDPGG